jgi:hypothetical protein
MHRITLLTLFVLTQLSGCIIYVPAEGRLLERQQTLELPAVELTTLIATTTAGNLIVVGEAGRSKVEAHALIRYYEADDVTLQLERRGESAVLNTLMNRRLTNGNTPHIDLTVTVPANFSVKLEDGSGDIEITGVQGDLDLNDGSGNLRVQGGHHVTVVDGSGDLQIEEATGDVAIEDGSGDLVAQRIGGTVSIDDGSGDIEVDQAGGITIESAGSGGLSIRKVGNEAPVR